MKAATGQLTGKIVEEQVAGEQSRGETGRRLLRGARDTMKAATGKLTGKQDLLDLRTDLALQRTKAEDHDREIEALKRQVASITAIRMVAIGTFVIALLALGTALWAAL